MIKNFRFGCASHRFAIYANNRMAALRTALEQNFKTLVAYCGAPGVRPLLREYCQAHPPTSPYLVYFGERLSEFLRRRGLFVEADLAALDYAWLSALMAPEVIAAAATQLTKPGRLSQLQLNPSFCICSCQTHNLAQWLSLTQQSTQQPLPNQDDNAQLHTIDVLLYRNQHMQINVLPLNEPESLFIECLLQGLTVEKAAQRVASGYPAFSLSEWFARLLVMGAFYEKSE
ncbi:DNA-binding domain-containing protein [Idiomarina aquatica]|nr:DNA-binding domain-containing protein [Idiomarina aquatica]